MSRLSALAVPTLVVASLLAAPLALAAPPEQARLNTATAELAPASDSLGLPATAGAVVEHATAPLTEAVSVAGVVLDADARGAQVWVRTVTDGVTGAWEEVDVDPAGAATDADEARHASEAIVLGDADSVEVATTASGPTGARLEVYSSPARAQDAAASDLAWDTPRILSRSAWGADESLVKRPYTYASVTGAMVHHTAGTNDYSAAQVPALLRGIQAYHVNGRGWNDIGYNVLVDKYGRIWEGRGGGINQPVQAGHGWGVTNARVFGISLMGNYEVVRPPAVMLESMNQVIAWKFQMHGVNPHGETWGSGGQDGGSTWLPAISGHRDENATNCPGRYVYSQMGAIRSRVKTIMDSTWFPRFRDVGRYVQFEPEIRWLAQRGVSTGWADGTYRPWSPIAREAMAAFIYRLAGSPEFTPPVESPFTDVPTWHQFYKEITWLAETGITTGWDDGTFRPGASVTRETMAAYLFRLYNVVDSTDAGSTAAPFVDVEGSPFATEITWLASTGITTGWADGTFRPHGVVNRDAMAAFMQRSITRLGEPPR